MDCSSSETPDPDDLDILEKLLYNRASEVGIASNLHKKDIKGELHEHKYRGKRSI
jgi:hypothetical protein